MRIVEAWDHRGAGEIEPAGSGAGQCGDRRIIANRYDQFACDGQRTGRRLARRLGVDQPTGHDHICVHVPALDLRYGRSRRRSACEAV